ncbi:PREDICTED: uncharacterized protein LOC109207338 [Nicotiana attenuata]|uniref:uncharacterized protein LOC109207338 n=1 Tax=Nicotiana attenuata TaxID=49451 RepID=UPI000904B02D|nr:PREDICTED: uncharacterized protein LOC109207338 [Nicotiana attenuata]
MTLVNTVFDGRGYPGWKRSILLSLSAKKKLGFINGACKAPDLNSTEYKQWSCVNDMVTSWILNALSKDIADSVIYSKTAKELWDSLEQRFGKSNGAKLFHLQKELSSLTKGNNNIAGYFTKIKRLWDELDALNVIITCSCVCLCEGKAKLTKSLEDQRLIQFLMGLNDVYAQARGNILMMSPLPSVDITYSLLLQDENQREIYVNAHFSSDSTSFMVAGQGKQQNAQIFADFAAFMAARQGRNNQRFRNQAPRGTMTAQKFNNPAQKVARPQQKFRGKKKYNPNLSCTYCGKIGHKQEDCYRLIGFPDDFEFTNPKTYQNHVKANVATTHEEDNTTGQSNETNSSSFGQHFSKEQIAEMMEIYKQAKSAQTGSSGINENDVAELPIYGERQFNVKVKMIRSDNALELGNGTQEADLIASEVITHQLTCVGTPQQNGIAERKHRHLLEAAFQSTKYDYLRNYGCLCYASTLTQGRSKFDERATTCMLIGYPLNQKGYKLLELETKRIFVSRDVKFFESHFPFAKVKPSHNPVFSDSSLSLDSNSSQHIQPEISSTLDMDPHNTTSPPSPSFQPNSSDSYITPTPHQPVSPVPHTSPHTYPTNSPVSTPRQEAPLRRSDRITQQPVYLKDYVCNSIMFADLDRECFSHPTRRSAYSFSSLTINNQHLIQSLSTLNEPRSYEQASHHPGWRKAMESEIQALQDNQT